jgi:penicillin-binding protein 1A
MKRQVGSTFKPVIYAAALDKGYSPCSIVTDSPITFKVEGVADADAGTTPWRPHNYEGKFEGEMPIRSAFIHSMNVPTVKLLDQIGVDYGIKFARQMGITAVMPRDLTIGLGSVATSLEEIMRAYAVFPRLGRTINLVYIKKVVDASGAVLEEAPPVQAISTNGGVPDASDPSLAISPQTAYVMTDMLKGVVREGTGAEAAAVPAVVAGKTGTSSNHRDTWFIGFTPHVMTGVWIGYLKDKPLDVAETGGKTAAPVFTEYMTSVVKAYPKTDFTIPDNIVFAYIDRHTGHLATAQTQKRVRVAFKVGTVPNTAGDNLPRIGEPGARTMSADASAVSPAVPTTASTTEDQAAVAPVQKDDGATSDYLRQGYQD